ncbi:MAG: OmpA family protein [Methylococcales bacterium]|nr:OmpA family protein [Methylococcales bacterium]
MPMLNIIQKAFLIYCVSGLNQTVLSDPKAKMLNDRPNYCTIFAYLNAGNIPKECPKIRKKRGVKEQNLKEKTISFQSIYFSYSKVALLKESFDVLDTIVLVLKHPKMSKKIIRIEGHTDARGSDRYNQLLSKRRAIVVKNYFVQHGVKAKRLITRGYGAQYLYDSEHPEDGINRRVEFVNITL